jgi:hypothetical protein
MKRKFLTILALWAGSCITPVVLLAHHSFAAEFDDSKPIKVTGTVTKVEWTNPHIWYYVDVKNPDGTVTNWGFAGGAPGQLMRRGIFKEAVKVGSTVIVEGFRAKDGSNNASSGRVTFADGKQVFTAGTEDRLPDQGKKQ